MAKRRVAPSAEAETPDSNSCQPTKPAKVLAPAAKIKIKEPAKNLAARQKWFGQRAN
jgi:hypothetical protein